MLEKAKSLFGRIGASGARQQQREAMIDLLIWTMYADRVVSLPENERIDQVADELSRQDPALPSAQYLGASIAKVRDVLSDEGRAAALLQDIHDRLGTPEMRRKAYETCQELARADGELVEDEQRFLETVRAKFDLD